jgi:hypothetical protein
MVKEALLIIRDYIYSFIPAQYQFLVPLFLFTLLIVAYSVFIYYFYIFQSKRDIIKLNLSKYNTAKHPFLDKLFASMLYILEFIVIMPVLSGAWFVFLSIFLVILSKNQSLPEILMVSAALVASIRITAYFTEDLSKDLAKMLPIILLGLFILGENFFELDLFMQRIAEVPSLFYSIPLYLIFIFGIELLMRIGSLFMNGGDDSD